jgi:predicted nucleotidyltransferase
MDKSPDQIRKVVKDVVNALKARKVRVDKVILYGSYAYGKPEPDSDIDLAVISRSFNKKGLLKRQELLGEAVFWLKEPVEMIGYSYSEYEGKTKSPFLSLILSKGRVVYEE